MTQKFDDVIVKQDGRLVYVDPNQTNHFNGTKLTPNYEDMCITVDLVVEIADRLQENKMQYLTSMGTTVKNETQTFVISCSSKTTQKHHQSLNDGWSFQNNGEHYLTTYFTDISYDSYKQKTEIQGLGISSIDIAFESYIAPTVTIKFVDVRGSAIWAREEALHVDNKLQSENIFGCFFTNPYPRFKLLVKGFYGRPITMNLICSSFKGSFNAQTGNFEADAQFVGFSFAFLSDIPFAYLAAAPQSPYLGYNYFEANKYNDNWLLKNQDGTTRPMIRLKDYMDGLYAMKEHKTNLETYNNTTENLSVDDLEELTERQDALNNIMSLYDKMVECSIVNDNIAERWYESTTQFLLPFYFDCAAQDTSISNTTTKVTLSSVTMDAIAAFKKAISDYNDKFPSVTLGTMSDTSNGSMAFTNPLIVMNMANINGTIMSGFIKGDDMTKTVKDRLNIALDKSFIGVLQTFERNHRVSQPNRNKVQYVALINTGNILENVKTQYDEITIRIEDIRKMARTEQVKTHVEEIAKEINFKSAEISDSDAIKNAMSVTPYLGNVLRIILAHLETLMYMIYNCTDTINEQQRTVEDLGITVDMTDLPQRFDKEKGAVPPFPGVFAYHPEKTNRQEWRYVGDISANFEEIELVNGILRAFQGLDNNINIDAAIKVPIYHPLLPSDVVNGQFNPMQPIKFKSIPLDSFAGYVALRAIQVLGIFLAGDAGSSKHTEAIQTFARFDAYNCLIMNPVSSTDYFKSIDGTDQTQAIMSIIQCDDTAKQYAGENQNNGIFKFAFEVAPNVNGSNNRQPILRSNGSNYSYTYATRDNVGFVPARLEKWEKMVSPSSSAMAMAKVVNTEGDLCVLAENYINNASTNLLITCSDKTLLGEQETKPSNNVYRNPSLFSILIRPDMVAVVDQLTTRFAGCEGLITINLPTNHEATDDNGGVIMERFWKTTEDDYKTKFSGVQIIYNPKWKRNDADSTPTDKWGILNTDGTVRTDYCPLVDTTLSDYQDTAIIPFTSAQSDEEESSDPADDKTTNEDNKENAKDSEGKTTKKVTAKSTSNDGYYMSAISHIDGESNGINLFGNPFYYLQNSCYDGESAADKWRQQNLIKIKSLLFLHTVSSACDFTPMFMNRNKTAGSVETLPYLYIALLGGLLWRYRSVVDNKDNVELPDLDDVFIWGDYKNIPYTDSLYSKIGNIYQLNINKTSSTSHLSVAQCFYGNTSNVSSNSIESFAPDYHVQNELIQVFMDFTDNQFKKILNTCELILNNGGKVELFKSDEQWNKLMIDDSDSYIKTYETKFNEYNQGNDNEVSLGTINSGLQSVLKKTCTLNKGDFFKTYLVALFDSSKTYVNLLFSETADVGKIMNDLYKRRVIITDTYGKFVAPNSTDDGAVSIAKSDIETYVTTFMKTLCDNMGEGKNIIQPTTELDNPDGIGMDKCSKMGVYMYLKNLYDNWLVDMPFTYFEVENFIKKFVIVDEYFQNIEYKIMLNCDKWLTTYNESVKENTFWYVLSQLGKNCHCAFISTPTFPMAHSSDMISKTKMTESLIDAFRPIPYNQIQEYETVDTFVYLYTDNKAKHFEDTKNFLSDSFDLYSYAGDTPSDIVAPAILSGCNGGVTMMIDGFDIPSFGVSFGSQDQSHFTNLKLSMENPIINSQSASIIEHIANLGNNEGNQVAFMGQDIYNAHSSYAYKVEIEAMGNMQIQQLMYFQLLNVPMYRGTYVIQRVIHNITPGHMKTTFSGFKMSKWMLPYNKEWYVKLPFVKDRPKRVGGTLCPCPDSDQPTDLTSSSYTAVSKSQVQSEIDSKKFYYNICGSVPNGKTVYKELYELNWRLCKEIELLPENQPTVIWNMGITCLYNENSAGDHKMNNTGTRAMDVQIIVSQNGSWTVASKNTDEALGRCWKIVDILAQLHANETRQVIMEFYDTSWKNFNVLHIATTSDPNDKHEVFVSNQGPYGSTWRTTDNTLDMVPPEYKQIAGRFWSVYDHAEFKKRFTTYGSVSDSALDEHFKGITQATVTGTTSTGTTLCPCPPSGVSDIPTVYTGSDYYFAIDAIASINHDDVNVLMETMNRMQSEIGLDPNCFLMMCFAENRGLKTGTRNRYTATGLFQLTDAAKLDIEGNARKKKVFLDIVDECSGKPTGQLTANQQLKEGILYYFYIKTRLSDNKRPYTLADIKHPGILFAFNQGQTNINKLKNITDYTQSTSWDVNIQKLYGTTLQSGINWMENSLKKAKGYSYIKDKDMNIVYAYMPHLKP